MKPLCKGEGKWKYWREENPRDKGCGFKTWAKKMMKRAVRRFLKKIESNER